MKFIADLHVHSHFSRATARNLDLEHINMYSQLKGIQVVGTGDFTHPGWFAEIKEKLVPAEEGLFRLKDDIQQACDDNVPLSCRQPVRYLLTCEISNIYKKNGKTRKNHNLVFMPDLDTAADFRSRLERIGNIRSDGRPILGLDARNLLEVVLDTSERAFLVPAHIWTPWFSMLGSRSGFDSVKECFEDLTPHIFAVETGLSSNPSMNWRVSDLDGLTLISNSDAHSPAKLGREANWFDTQLSYSAIRNAMETGDPAQFLGTFEFYPEQGKYHLDGHRNCDIRCRPDDSIRYKGICPVCGKPLTLGVLYRVEALADRPEGGRPEKTHPFYSLIPLTDILAEIFKVGPDTKTVQSRYQTAVNELGPEFDILHCLPVQEIERIGIPLLAEAINRVRQQQVSILPGYDGEYGTINIFDIDERERLKGQKSLFTVPVPDNRSDGFRKMRLISKSSDVKVSPHQKRMNTIHSEPVQQSLSVPDRLNLTICGLNDRQKEAVFHHEGPIMIVAGPGTGKTRTITHKMAYLVVERQVSPEQILAVTFTSKAAREMKDRIRLLLASSKVLPWAGTFHSLCLKILISLEDKTSGSTGFFILDEADRRYMIREAVRQLTGAGIEPTLSPSALLDRIVTAKQQIISPEENLDTVVGNLQINEFRAVYTRYQHLLAVEKCMDYEDLIFNVVRILETDPAFCEVCRQRYPYIFVDEYQDLNHAQYRMIKALAPGKADICVIGDPDQSIYGFRGSDTGYFARFIDDYPSAKVVRLTQNYRSSETILQASHQIIFCQHQEDSSRIYSNIDGVKTISILEQGSETAEAVAIGKQIEQLVGGIGFHSMDFDHVDPSNDMRSYSFSDIAVLFRTGVQANVFSDIFDAAGIPFQRVSRDSVWGSEPVCRLISLLKLTDGLGSYADFERVLAAIGHQSGKKTLDSFKTWGYQNDFGIQDAMIHAVRLPIAGMSLFQQKKIYHNVTLLLELSDQVKNLTVDQKLIYFIKHTHGGELSSDTIRIQETIDDLIRQAASFGTDSREFLSMIALQTDTDTWNHQVEKVSLMTMHAAKGLEFPVVFISGCEKDLIPLSRPDQASTDPDEERRLFYVAMTRAKERLYLTYSRKRMVYGKCRIREPSPFIPEIEIRLRTHETGRIKSDRHDKDGGQVQLKLF